MYTDCNACQSGWWTSIYAYLSLLYIAVFLPLWSILPSNFPCGIYCRPPSPGLYCCAPNHSDICCSVSTSLSYIAIHLPLRGRQMLIYDRDVHRLQCMPEWLVDINICLPLSCVYCGLPSSLEYIAVQLPLWRILPSAFLWSILLCTKPL